eukprot:TRINITY_DN7929_c0_g1_i2.p1 TRINITY_DN7929_c0_g1~~TRINITY_DN7929_c0_g1_i2.p1  ORF type:complete len:132 (-),score=7.72 TRINITY_DN7929_c0_g1_i2:374-769(-)
MLIASDFSRSCVRACILTCVLMCLAPSFRKKHRRSTKVQDSERDMNTRWDACSDYCVRCMKGNEVTNAFHILRSPSQEDFKAKISWHIQTGAFVASKIVAPVGGAMGVFSLDKDKWYNGVEAFGEILGGVA